MISLNNKLLLKPYTGEKKARANISGGFATISQKTTLVGLVLMADFEMTSGVKLEKGSKVYFSEEVLYANDWSKTLHECDGIDGKFILAPFGSIICIA